MYKFVAYIPEDYLEAVKTALFDAGAGEFTGYSHCSWQVKGVGQFRPLAGSNPFLGSVGETEVVSEWRVEMIVPETIIKSVVVAYKAAHPYEVPAYDVYELVDLGEF